MTRTSESFRGIHQEPRAVFPMSAHSGKDMLMLPLLPSGNDPLFPEHEHLNGGFIGTPSDAERIGRSIDDGSGANTAQQMVWLTPTTGFLFYWNGAWGRYSGHQLWGQKFTWNGGPDFTVEPEGRLSQPLGDWDSITISGDTYFGYNDTWWWQNSQITFLTPGRWVWSSFGIYEDIQTNGGGYYSTGIGVGTLSEDGAIDPLAFVTDKNAGVGGYGSRWLLALNATTWIMSPMSVPYGDPDYDDPDNNLYYWDTYSVGHWTGGVPTIGHRNRSPTLTHFEETGNFLQVENGPYRIDDHRFCQQTVLGDTIYGQGVYGVIIGTVSGDDISYSVQQIADCSDLYDDPRRMESVYRMIPANQGPVSEGRTSNLFWWVYSPGELPPINPTPEQYDAPTWFHTRAGLIRIEDDNTITTLATYDSDGVFKAFLSGGIFGSQNRIVRSSPEDLIFEALMPLDFGYVEIPSGDNTIDYLYTMVRLEYDGDEITADVMDPDTEPNGFEIPFDQPGAVRPAKVDPDADFDTYTGYQEIAWWWASNAQSNVPMLSPDGEQSLTTAGGITASKIDNTADYLTVAVWTRGVSRKTAQHAATDPTVVRRVGTGS